MPTAKQQREKLIRLLKELFQLDQPDLDFGFWRIMHAKSKQVTEFLDKDLLKIVEGAFGAQDAARQAALEQAYQAAVQQAKDFGAPEPEKTPAVVKAKAALDAAADSAGAEADVYDHLYRFFERYYDNGDFLSRRYYSAESAGKAAAYAIPYDGREVYLHWANADQYYIKTTEYFANFSFDPTKAAEVQAAGATLFAGQAVQPLKVHFRIVQATEGEHGNVKALTEQKRFFLLHGANPAYFEDGQLVVGFEFRPDPEKTGQDRTWQDKRNAEAVERVLAALDDLAKGERLADAPKLDGRPIAELAGRYAAVLRTPAPTDKQPDRPLLAKYIAQYAARNTTDYFIHKDLGGFLRRELDFYIKNEVMRLDDIDSADAPRAESYLAKVRVLRAIAHKLIDFLAQLEDFQKKLWLKKKFIVETNWCITLDRILAIEDAKLRESLLAEIADNDPQRQEWVRLFAIDEIKKDLHKPGYSEPLTVEFLKTNPCLVLDTALFAEPVKAAMLGVIGELDRRASGLLVHSEASQALAILGRRFASEIQCIYIDPPYNTSETGFIYKNEYKHSSWCTMVANAVGRGKNLLTANGVLACTIDDLEQPYLELVFDGLFGFGGRLGALAIETKPSGRTNDNFLATCHEYCLFYAGDTKAAQIVFFELTEEQKQQYGQQDTSGAFKWRDFLRTGGLSTPEERPNSCYPIYCDRQSGSLSLEEKPGSEAIWPIDSEGRRRVWRKTPPSFLRHLAAGEIQVARKRDGSVKVQIIDRIKEGIRPKSMWVGSRYDAATHGTKLLKDLFGESGVFTFPKSLHATKDVLYIVAGDDEDAIVCDFFAGSGTTGHAVIALNREDGGARGYVLVEMGNHFTSAILPRMKKVIYSADWQDGKPASRKGGVSQAFKYIRLETYEDALNNLAFADDVERERALAANAGLRQDYMLHYMLDVETKGSASLLDIDAFADPTAYKLKVKKPGTDEHIQRNVDLIETFNYLVGLRVEHLAAPQRFAAAFRREKDGDLPKDTDTRLILDGKLRQDEAGPWWFRRVEGWLPAGQSGGREKVLVIWRKLTGDLEKDNAVLDQYCLDLGINSRDFEFDTIYVNGSNNLPNLKRQDDKWKVRLIEEDFHRLMWDVEDA